MINKIKNQYGLKSIPFSKTIGANELFQSNSLKIVNEKLGLALVNEDFALITGAAGSGKSSALRYFISQADPQVYPHVYITAENYNIGEIAKLILEGLHAKVPFQGYTALRNLKSFIQKQNSERNIKPIIVIDEAQDLPVPTLSSVKNIANYKMDSQSMLLIIFCGQNELINKINMASLASLRRRIRIRYKFENLSLEETTKYIKYQMQRVGVGHQIFSDEAIAEIFKISQGIICNINNICFDLLIEAASKSKDIIEPSLLQTIILPT